MREILFKAKRADNGEWIEGALVQVDDSEDFYYIMPRYNLASSLSPLDLVKMCSKKVLPETLCEFTGLYDKDGKRIWENDIVKVYCDADGYFDTRKDVFGKIVFDDDTFYDWEISYNHIQHDREESMCNQSHNIEVVGNSIDNPELLTAERNE